MNSSPSLVGEDVGGEIEAGAANSSNSASPRNALSLPPPKTASLPEIGFRCACRHGCLHTERCERALASTGRRRADAATSTSASCRHHHISSSSTSHWHLDREDCCQNNCVHVADPCESDNEHLCCRLKTA
ncbi:unnamed protein product [Schistocephalus solidus]|uniref:Uncharacterized protein n=1 Tax=Schistocephalus solidus TaxID=70667 RepID=A0A3P7D8Z6_SCHSO|nr:unnamed protein product [Schistocephalus solidus]